MDCQAFIDAQVKEIQEQVGDGTAVTALSGGVDSATATVLAHRALGDQLETYFVENGLMRKNEAQWVVDIFADLGIEVQVVDEKDTFLGALEGLTDPEEKRQAVTDTFYADVLARLVRESGARHLLQGTILTDIEETVAGVKRQHNILEQLGIDTEAEYGYTVLEPLKELRKDGVREVAEALGMPDVLSHRIPFPGPALATRIVGQVTEERLKTVREATAIVENELGDSGAFQYMAVLLNDKATGLRHGGREFGQIIVVRCVESVDARTATATRLPWEKLEQICERIVDIPDVNRCLYDLTPKPPATIEYI
jgi:GMP synthase (glutamine-hydrolysing)